MVALAGALLVAPPWVAVGQPRLAGPLADEGRDRGLVGAEGRPDALRGGRDAAGGLPAQRQRELQPAGAVQRREQARGAPPGRPRRCPSPRPLRTRPPRGRGTRQPAVGPRDRPRGALPALPDMASSDLPGPADSALRVSDSHIHPYMCG